VCVCEKRKSTTPSQSWTSELAETGSRNRSRNVWQKIAGPQKDTSSEEMTAPHTNRPGYGMASLPLHATRQPPPFRDPSAMTLCTPARAASTATPHHPSGGSRPGDDNDTLGERPTMRKGILRRRNDSKEWNGMECQGLYLQALLVAPSNKRPRTPVFSWVNLRAANRAVASYQQATDRSLGTDR
jgi:hypothetical protein